MTSAFLDFGYQIITKLRKLFCFFFLKTENTFSHSCKMFYMIIYNKKVPSPSAPGSSPVTELSVAPDAAAPEALKTHPCI